MEDVRIEIGRAAETHPKRMSKSSPEMLPRWLFDAGRRRQPLVDEVQMQDCPGGYRREVMGLRETDTRAQARVQDLRSHPQTVFHRRTGGHVLY